MMNADLGRLGSLSMNCRLAVYLLLSTVTASAGAQSLGSTFTYQGQLTESGQPATGLFDLQACLYDSLAATSPVACAPDLDDVPVENGLFTVALDFGTSVFTGQQRYLELRVRPGDGIGSFTPLLPRQLVRATPEALRASEAGAAATVPWSGLTGVPAGFADGVDDNSGGTVTSVTAGTGLAGGTITDSGTIGIAAGGVGAIQIDSAEVQARVTGGCPPGSYFEAINSDGSVSCARAVRSVTAGVGLTGGTITDTGTVALADGGVGSAQIDPSEVQARVTGVCPIGSYLRGITADGSAICTELINQTQLRLVDGRNRFSGRHSSVGIGTDDLPLISFSAGSSFSLFVSKCHSPDCTNVTTSFIDAGGTSWTSIAIGSDGMPVISYYDSSNHALKFAKCNDPACSGGDEFLRTIDSSGDVGHYSSIAISADGTPIISYAELVVIGGASNDFALKVAKCDNSECSSRTATTVDDAGNVGTFTSIAIGPDDLPIISYRDNTNTTLKVAKCNDSACSGNDETITTVDDSTNNVGVFSDISIGGDGLPVIAYQDATAGTLKVAKCNDAACAGGDETISIVSGSTNNKVRWISIMISSDGFPIISYQDDDLGALKIAKCNDLACSGNDEIIRTLDNSDNDVGEYSSIAIDSDGLPVISYHDVTAGDLKVAKCGTPSCR